MHRVYNPGKLLWLDKPVQSNTYFHFCLRFWEIMVSILGNLIVRAGLPFESRCFGHYWYIHFLVPPKTSWNSASEDPKIIYKGQIKDQIKGQESSSLWLTQNNWFHKSKVVEAFQRMSFFSTREWMFCAKQLLFCGKNMWWVIKASSNGSFL